MTDVELLHEALATLLDVEECRRERHQETQIGVTTSRRDPSPLVPCAKAFE